MFTYDGANRALLSFFNAIELVMETGFAITAFLALILNLIIPEETENEENGTTANENDADADEQEWSRIKGRRKAADVPERSDAEKNIV